MKFCAWIQVSYKKSGALVSYATPEMGQHTSRFTLRSCVTKLRRDRRVDAGLRAHNFVPSQLCPQRGGAFRCQPARLDEINLGGVEVLCCLPRFVATAPTVKMCQADAVSDFVGSRAAWKALKNFIQRLRTSGDTD